MYLIFHLVDSQFEGDLVCDDCKRVCEKFYIYIICV